VLRLDRELDLEAVNAAAPVLLGLQEFAAFCRHRPGATTIRTLLELSATRVRGGPFDTVVELTVRADAFCHSMVRSLTGALTEVGSGRRDAGWLAELTRSASRVSDVPVLAAHGLTLEEVGYPPDDQLGARVLDARNRRERPGPTR
jgi:tRNA pseudouridine38-40 synthase